VITVISYIKIIGPPVLKAVKELEKIAIDMPEVCIMNNKILTDIPSGIAEDIGGESIPYEEIVSRHFFRRTGVKLPIKRCHNIISNSGKTLGEYDFFFEWFEPPNTTKILTLINNIDEALSSIGCRYTITSK
jgi:hypothetical protein